MKLELMLMRHGHATSLFGAERDHGRKLSDHGKFQAEQQAHLFLPKKDDAILAGDAVRTRQTTEVLHNTWANAIHAVLPHTRFSNQAYLAEASMLIELVRMTDPNIGRLWVVAHNPGISEFASLLTGAPIGMSTADIVEVDLGVEQWMDIVSGCGRLVGHHPSALA